MIDPRQSQRKTALVTGASSGIGREFAREFASHGYNLVLAARTVDRLRELATELEQRHGITAIPIRTDLSEPNAPQELYSEVRKRRIDVDILVNNAGFNVYGPFTQTNHTDELRLLQVNLVALVTLTKLLIPDMIERGFGRILNLGSTGSFAPAPFDSLYAASKAFVLSFSEAIGEELKGTGVTVTTLCPGPTQTEFAERAGMGDVKIFSGRLMSAQKVASIGYKAMIAGGTTVIVGLANRLQVWSMRFAPRSMVTKVAKGLMSRRRASLRADAQRA
ncbi:MAG TPA: SDR family oxidoreductase [Acidobacteriaceae bacterium]